MADKIEFIEKEIKKIKDRLGKLKKNKAESKLDKNIQLTTVSLLKNVIEDLRQQQQKLTNSKDQEQYSSKKILLGSALALKVNEIFFDIQGESSYAGWPCVFIRLTGCNLRCSYCDTVYAYEEGKEKTIAEILEEIKRFPCTLIEITGGEPLLQSDTPMLIETLFEKNYRVLLETNGSLAIKQ